MEAVKVSKSVVSGTAQAPPSKSGTHRALVMAALADGESRVRNPLVCDDTGATLNALRKLGTEITCSESLFTVRGGRLKEPTSPIDCGASGTTLRFIAAFCSLVDGVSVLTGVPSLMGRPHGPLLDALGSLGVEAKSDDQQIIIKSNGSVCGGEIELPPDVSSQFVSAMLIIAPRAQDMVTIKLSAPLESKPYAELTMQMQRCFGVSSGINADGTLFECHPQQYRPAEVAVDGDWSSAAFLLGAGALAGEVTVTGLGKSSLQPDRRILDALTQLGASVTVGEDSVAVRGDMPFSGLEFDLSDCPDLLPVLSILCSVADGESHLSGIPRTRLKESNRVEAVRAGLLRCGISTGETRDELAITGGKPRAASVESFDDHRIAMAFAVLGLAVEQGISISSPQSVSKSFPQFFDKLKALGAKVEAVS